MSTYTGIMNCLRCNKGILHPNSINANYVIAPEFITKEPREVFVALRDNKATLDKKAKKEPVDDSEYDRVEAFSSLALPVAVKILVEMKNIDVQKTGIICPDCFNLDTDFVIWGVHK